MSKPKGRFTAAMQYAGLVAKPSLSKAAVNTVAAAYTNAALAIGEVGLIGAKATGHKVAVVSGRIRRSPAARDVKAIGRKAGYFGATAATAVAVSVAGDLMRSGLNRGVKAAVASRAGKPRPVRPVRPVKAQHRKAS